MKKKVPLIAIEIQFTYFSIVYKVAYEDGYKHLSKKTRGIISAPNNIKKKDLCIKATILSEDMEVVFNCLYMTPHFYQSLVNKTRKDFEEHRTELNNIYKVGEIVGYLFL